MSLKRLRVACIQTNAGVDWERNWKQAEEFLIRAADQKAQIAALPENFILRAAEKNTNEVAPQIFNEVLSRVKKIAVNCRMAIVAGSLLEPFPGQVRSRVKKFFNTCFVFSEKGELILRYRKMHLFDIHLPQVQVRETKTIVPGTKPGFFKSFGIKSGVGICYDLRFPEYFRVLSKRGSEILFVPANFTAETGKTAWEALLRARAIENQSYVIAPGQCGRHPGSGILSYGHSLIIDPVGRVLKQASFDKPQLLLQDLKLEDLRQFRRLFPVLKHRNPSV